MVVNVELPVAFPRALAVPADAVLDSGLKKTVFVERGEGLFSPRVVETGRRFGDRVEIVKGLQAGEKIVVSGNFLIGSESRLQEAAETYAPSAEPQTNNEASTQTQTDLNKSGSANRTQPVPTTSTVPHSGRRRG
jgi:Cu(I)/Ag(I) efflux system membrane fusion protein